MQAERLRLGALALLMAFSWVSCKDQTTSPAPAKGLDSPGLLGATSGSQNYIHVFTDYGVYAYHCAYHTNAHDREPGVVLVQDGAQDSAFVSISQGAFHPETVVVRLNGQVRWQNFDDGVHHSVTSD